MMARALSRQGVSNKIADWCGPRCRSNGVERCRPHNLCDRVRVYPKTSRGRSHGTKQDAKIMNNLLTQRQMDTVIAEHPATLRRQKRYARLASKCLPAWAPEPFIAHFSNALGALALARYSDRNLPFCEANSDETELKRCQERLLRLKRLCDPMYVGNGDLTLEKAWKKIGTEPITDPDRARRIQDGRGVVDYFLCKIDTLVDQFQRIPKLTRGGRLKSLEQVTMAIDDLLQAMHESPEASDLATEWPMDYFAQVNFELRAEHGMDVTSSELASPKLAIRPRADKERISALDESVPPHWRDWSDGDKYAWLYSEVEISGLVDLLRGYRMRIDKLGAKNLHIRQPGREGNGWRGFLIRALDAFLQELYSENHRELLALMVSAIMGLETTLTSSDIRSYLQTGGNNLGSQRTRRSPDESGGKTA